MHPVGHYQIYKFFSGDLKKSDNWDPTFKEWSGGLSGSRGPKDYLKPYFLICGKNLVTSHRHYLGSNPFFISVDTILTNFGQD